jgi:V/A-type H+/Na+-transporting ATPase subunit F
MKYKIAIVGTKEITAGFAAVGFDAINITEDQEIKTVLFELKKETLKNDKGETYNKYAIIFIIEEFLKEVSKEDYEKLSVGALPAIIPIPSHKGATGFGEEKIKKIVEKAVGSDIFG